ncbi:MAG: hypothetical protein KatS3mg024_1477 [Armatimonadota bacterium]|nr:MAG: hypothetical protein KatS3mg024_1477 [Armatimonadota bacterium]
MAAVADMAADAAVAAATAGNAVEGQNELRRVRKTEGFRTLPLSGRPPSLASPGLIRALIPAPALRDHPPLPVS